MHWVQCKQGKVGLEVAFAGKRWQIVVKIILVSVPAKPNSINEGTASRSQVFFQDLYCYDASQNQAKWIDWNSWLSAHRSLKSCQGIKQTTCFACMPSSSKFLCSLAAPSILQDLLWRISIISDQFKGCLSYDKSINGSQGRSCIPLSLSLPCPHGKAFKNSKSLNPHQQQNQTADTCYNGTLLSP